MLRLVIATGGAAHSVRRPMLSTRMALTYLQTRLSDLYGPPVRSENGPLLWRCRRLGWIELRRRGAEGEPQHGVLYFHRELPEHRRQQPLLFIEVGGEDHARWIADYCEQLCAGCRCEPGVMEPAGAL